MPSVSPRAKQLRKGSNQSKEQIFKKKFRDMAMQQFMSKMPKIGDRVSGFRIIESNPDEGSAVGTFVIKMGENPVIVPAILSDNKLEEFDMMVAKGLDTFLPLNEEWMKELAKIQKNKIGDSAEQPDQISTDKDLRNVVIPPSTGRYSYASSDASDTPLVLPAYLDQAPNRIKESFIKTLKNDKEYAKRAFNTYGEETLKKALRKNREKEATNQDVSFVTIETPEQEMKRLVSQNPYDVDRIYDQGYDYEDNRAMQNKNVAVQIDYETILTNPKDAGLYRIFLSNGNSKEALIIPAPLDVCSFEQKRGNPDVSNLAGPDYDWKSSPDYGDTHPSVNRDDHEGVNYMGITTDGELFYTKRDFVAERISKDDIDSESFKDKLTNNESDTPSNGNVGFFFDQRGSRLLATTPLKIKNVSTDGTVTNIQTQYHNGYKKVQFVKRDGYDPMKPRIISDPDSRKGETGIQFDKGVRRNETKKSADIVALLPDNYRFVKADRVMDPDRILKTPKAVEHLHSRVFKEMGAEPVDVKEGGAGYFWIDDNQFKKFGALKHLVDEKNLEVPHAEQLIEEASRNKKASALLTNKYEMAKLAGLTKEAAPSPAQMGQPGPSRKQKKLRKLRQQRRESQGDQTGGEEKETDQGPEPQEQNMVEVPAQKLKMLQQKIQQSDQKTEILQKATKDVIEAVSENNKKIRERLKSKKENLESQIMALKTVVQRAKQLSQSDGEAPDLSPDQVPSGGPSGEPQAMDMTAAKQAPQKGTQKGPKTQQKQLFDTASVASIAEQNAFDESVNKFMPLLRDSLDSIGRMLMNMRTNKKDIEERMGRETYNQMHQRLTNLFENFGEIMIGLNESITKDMSG